MDSLHTPLEIHVTAYGRKYYTYNHYLEVVKVCPKAVQVQELCEKLLEASSMFPKRKCVYENNVSKPQALFPSYMVASLIVLETHHFRFAVF